MEAVRLTGPEQVELVEVPAPEPEPDEVVIAVEQRGICGSDIHAYHGRHPFVHPPVVLGHEFAGRIARVGSGVGELSEGQRVTVEPSLVCGECYNCTIGRYNICDNLQVIGCQTDGGFADYVTVPAAKTIPLPDNLTMAQGAMVEPLAVAYHALRVAGFEPGMQTVVLGAGTIGLCTLLALREQTAGRIVVTDVLDEKLERASDLGADLVLRGDAGGVVEQARDFFGRRADVVFDCVTNEASIAQAVALAEKGGRIVVEGVPGGEVPVPLHLVQDREIELRGALMYLREDYNAAIDAISGGRADVDALITDRFPLERVADAFERIDAAPAEVVKVQIGG
ncbi:MAG: zinc-binding dehydrogenase [Rubrobacteraceae bacterium]